MTTACADNSIHSFGWGQELSPRVRNPERIVRENPDLIWRLGMYSARPISHPSLWTLCVVRFGERLTSAAVFCFPAETFFSLPVDIQNMLTGPWEDSEEERKAVRFFLRPVRNVSRRPR